MIRRSVWSDFVILFLAFLRIRKGADKDQHADDDGEGEKDGESLAHRLLRVSLQSCKITGAKVLPVVWSCVRKAVPVALETFGEPAHSRMKLRNAAQRV